MDIFVSKIVSRKIVVLQVLHTSVAEELEDIEAKMEQSVMLANKKSRMSQFFLCTVS